LSTRPSSGVLILIGIGAAQAATFEPTSPGALPLTHGTWQRSTIFRSNPGLVVPVGESTVTLLQENTVSDGAQTGGLTGALDTTATRADPVTGEVGVSISGGTTSFLEDEPSIRAQAAIFDLLTFDFASGSTGTVSYSVSIDGTISNADLLDTSNYVSATTTVGLYDVTDAASPFIVFGSEGSLGNGVGPQIDVEFGPGGSFTFANEVSFARGGLAVIPSALEPAFLAGSLVPGLGAYRIDTGGEVFKVDQTISDSFTVSEGRTYALFFESVARGGDRTTADFLGTSTFELAIPEGTSVTTASGVLPVTTMASPVPVPAAMPLLVAGLALLGALKARRAPRAGLRTR
jgi:hypothetical protein